MTFPRLLTPVLLSIALTMSPVAVSVSLAQDAGYSDETLSSFVDAAIEIERLRSEYQPQVEAAADDSERQALVAEANAEMAAAIESTGGMSVQEFAAIGEAVAADQALNARVTEMIQARSGG